MFDPNLVDEHGKLTLLEKTITERDVNQLNLLLEHPDIDPNKKTLSFTPVVLCVVSRMHEHLSLLLRHPKTHINLVLKVEYICVFCVSAKNYSLLRSDVRFPYHNDPLLERSTLEKIAKYWEPQAIHMLLSDPHFIISEDATKSRIMYLSLHNHDESAVDVFMEDGRFASNSAAVLSYAVHRYSYKQVEKLLAHFPMKWGDVSALKVSAGREGMRKLLHAYDEDHDAVRAHLRNKLGIDKMDAESLLARVISVQDGYLGLVVGDDPPITFFKIMLLLPHDLQALVCNRVYSVPDDTQQQPHTFTYHRVLSRIGRWGK